MFKKGNLSVSSVPSAGKVPLTIAGGLQRPTSGEIIINQVNFSQLNEKQRGKLRLKRLGLSCKARI